MVDANEKEPRSIRLQGLSECQRQREREREKWAGEGCEQKRPRERRQEDEGLNRKKTQILSPQLV